MKMRDHQRERRVALALLIRRHLIVYKDDIKTAYETQLAANTPPDKHAPQQATKSSTALAKLIGLDPYPNAGKGKPEPAKYLLDFVQSAGPEHFEKIARYFRDHVITAEYRSEAPPYIQMAIHEVFDVEAELEPVAQLRSAYEQARYAPHVILAALEETQPDYAMLGSHFEGVWNIIRYSHNGKRVVRLAATVTTSGTGRPIFNLFFRPYGLTVTSSETVFRTCGSVIVLKGGQHVMFFGHEVGQNPHIVPNRFATTIICPTRVARDGPFIGLMQQRHDDGKIFSIKAQFVRARDVLTEQLIGQGKVGSFESEREIAAMGDDIPGLDGLLAELRRSPDDVKGGLVL